MGFLNVIFFFLVFKYEIVCYISLMDVVFVLFKKLDIFKMVIFFKIFENVLMEKFILLGVEGESKVIIEKYQVGFCFELENKVDF